MGTQQLLTPDRAAEYLQSTYGFGTTRTLAKWRTVGGGPIFRKIGARVVYTVADIDAWASSRMTAPMASTSERAADA